MMNFQPLLKRLQMVVYYLIMSDITFFTNIPIIIHVCKQKMSGTIKTVIKPAVNDFFAVIRRMKQILVIVYITAEEFVDSMMSK